ncbi:hypothetical protein CPC08DRAFT_711584 [Agrocybe pediades]|nr:hypothetical protein CPC08DRAFT_711584 [Agrocybe pediades]
MGPEDSEDDLRDDRTDISMISLRHDPDWHKRLSLGNLKRRTTHEDFREFRDDRTDITMLSLQDEPDWHTRYPWDDDLYEVAVSLHPAITKAMEHNHPLSDADLAFVSRTEMEVEETIRPYISEERLSAINKEIAELAEQESLLRQKLLPTHANAWSAKAPFTNLPDKVQRLIFFFCIDSRPSPMVDEAPLLLCRVSSQWKRVALSMPEIWSEIYIPFGEEYRHKTGGLKKLLNLFADRAGGLRLSINFDWHWDDSEDNTIPGPNIGDIDEEVLLQYYDMVKYLAKWEKNTKISQLIIYAPCMQNTLLFLDWEESTNQLEYLTLRGCKGCLTAHSSDPEHGYPTGIFQSPRMRALSIDHKVFVDIVRLVPGRPWLDFLHASCTSPSEWCTYTLAHFPMLQKAYYFFRQAERPVEIPETIAEYATLEELGLNYEFCRVTALGYDCFAPLCTFRFPNLRRLHIKLQLRTTPSPGDTLYLLQVIPLYSISGWTLNVLPSRLPSLRELTLASASSIPFEQVCSLLIQFDNLTVLKLRIPIWYELPNYLSFLTFMPAHPHINWRRNLPHLVEIGLELDHGTGPLNEAILNGLVSMVLSRCNPALCVRTLQSVWISNLHLASDEQFTALVEFVNGNLERYMFTDGLEVGFSRGHLIGSPEEFELTHWEDNFIV